MTNSPRTRTSLGLSVLLVAALVGNVLAWRERHARDSDVVVAVASQASERFFALDFRQVEDDIDAVLGLSTGSFRKEYAGQRRSIIRSVKNQELVVTAKVVQSVTGLEFLAGGRAQVLVSVNVSTRSKAGASDGRYRARLSLERDHGSWLVSKLEQVS